jgi:hypothetical protein
VNRLDTVWEKYVQSVHPQLRRYTNDFTLKSKQLSTDTFQVRESCFLCLGLHVLARQSHVMVVRGAHVEDFVRAFESLLFFALKPPSGEVLPPPPLPHSSLLIAFPGQPRPAERRHASGLRSADSCSKRGPRRAKLTALSPDGRGSPVLVCV